MWSKILLAIGYGSAAAAAVIATGGLASFGIPAAYAGIAAAVAAGANHLAQSPVRDFHDAVEAAQAAGRAAQAASDATKKNEK